MGTRHVTELHSAAYDGELSAGERRRYEDHLATCPDCAAAAEQFRQAIDAVHALPAARMPQRVVLPSTPPTMERAGGLAALLQMARRRVPGLRTTPAWGAGALAAAGIAAVVLVVHAHGGPSSNASTALSDRPQFAGGSQAGGAAAPNAQSRSASISVGACPLPQALVTASPGSAVSNPPGFDNRVTVNNAQRPGEQLILATTSNHVAPGSTVLVYAALTSTSGRHATVVPCVTLHDQGAVAFLPGANTSVNGQAADSGLGSSGAGPGSTPPNSATSSATVQNGTAARGTEVPAAQAAPPASSLLTPDQYAAFAPYTLQQPLAVAAPTAAALANLPLQVIQIPTTITSGTQLRLVALVPAGVPGSTDRPAIEAVLTLDVS